MHFGKKESRKNSLIASGLMIGFLSKTVLHTA